MWIISGDPARIISRCSMVNKMKQSLLVALCTLSMANAQDWSVVSKYFPAGFSADLDTLAIPEMLDNSKYNGYDAYRSRRIDVFAEYQGQEHYPRRIWNRFHITLAQYLVDKRKDFYEIQRTTCSMKDTVAPHDWSNCESPNTPTTLRLHDDVDMDWLGIDYIVSDYKPLPYPYPYSRLRPIRWDINRTSPRQGWYIEWLFDKRGRHQQIREFRGYGRGLLDFDIRIDEKGRDTLVKVWEKWQRKLPGHSDTTIRSGQVALHRMRYDSLGRLEFHMVDTHYDSSLPIEKQDTGYIELFTHQVYVYDKKGRNVARVQLRPYNRGILALTAMRFDAKDRVVRKTTYLVKDNKTVGDWVETVEWEYDSLGRTIRKSQYCHEALIKVLRKQPDTKWYYWYYTRW